MTDAPDQERPRQIRRIVCTGCDELGHGGPLARRRDRAEAEGWYDFDGDWYCPHCVAVSEAWFEKQQGGVTCH